MSSLAGAASEAGTAAYASQHLALSYQELDRTGWQVSQAGFGCYRVHVRVESHHQALRRALLRGINLIDTSTNYGDGGAEQLVGQILVELVASGQVARQQIVVVSKAGYLQGENYRLSQERKAAGRPFPDLVEYADGLEHCLHPIFLADQLDRSLDRLQLETLDVLLLHNPEYYLNWAHRAGLPQDEARQEYERRLALAFAHLEVEVAEGRIQYYGVSSNTFPAPVADPAFTPLTRLWTLAQELSTDHHFRVIQLPMNLLETGAATEPNQPEGQTALAVARQKQLGVLINRPLNAIQGDQLRRLAQPPVAETVSDEQVSTAVDTLVAAEDRFFAQIHPRLRLDQAMQQRAGQSFTAGQILQDRWAGFGDFFNWREVLAHYLLPRAQTAVDLLSDRPNLPAEAAAWLETYVAALNQAFDRLSAFYARRSAAQAEAIAQRAVAADAEWRAPTLSQTAVRALRSTAGVSSVLVGMRRDSYVDDVLAELQRPLAQRPRTDSWRALHSAGAEPDVAQA